MGNKEKLIKLGVVFSLLYLALQMTVDLSSVKPTLFFGFVVTVGSFIFPLTYLIRDFIHITLGKSLARLVGLTTVLINIFVVSWLYFASTLPYPIFWDSQEAFIKIFTTSILITTASITAELVSLILDTEIFHYYFSKQRIVSAIVLSNIVSYIVDILVFVFIALNHLPLNVRLEVIGVNLFIRAIYLSLIPFFLPLIKNKLK